MVEVVYSNPATYASLCYLIYIYPDDKGGRKNTPNYKNLSTFVYDTELLLDDPSTFFSWSRGD